MWPVAFICDRLFNQSLNQTVRVLEVWPLQSSNVVVGCHQCISLTGADYQLGGVDNFVWNGLGHANKYSLKNTTIFMTYHVLPFQQVIRQSIYIYSWLMQSLLSLEIFYGTVFCMSPRISDAEVTWCDIILWMSLLSLVWGCLWGVYLLTPCFAEYLEESF